MSCKIVFRYLASCTSTCKNLARFLLSCKKLARDLFFARNLHDSCKSRIFFSTRVYLVFFSKKKLISILLRSISARLNLRFYVVHVRFRRISPTTPYDDFMICHAWKRLEIIVWNHMIPCMELHGIACSVGSGKTFSCKKMHNYTIYITCCFFSRRFSKKNADYSSDFSFFKTNEVTDFINFYKLVCSSSCPTNFQS